MRVIYTTITPARLTLVSWENHIQRKRGLLLVYPATKSAVNYTVVLVLLCWMLISQFTFDGLGCFNTNTTGITGLDSIGSYIVYINNTGLGSYKNTARSNTGTSAGVGSRFWSRYESGYCPYCFGIGRQLKTLVK